MPELPEEHPREPWEILAEMAEPKGRGMLPMSLLQCAEWPGLEAFDGEDVPYIGIHPCGYITVLSGVSEEGHYGLFIHNHQDQWSFEIACDFAPSLAWGADLLKLPSGLIRKLATGTPEHWGR